MATRTDADTAVGALRSSVTRLRGLASAIGEAELAGRAYPAEWSIAQVLSHLGSGAVIMQRRLQDTLAGQATPDDFAPGVWNTWNAMAPAAQRDDALAADTALLACIEAVTPGEREAFTFGMGPMTFGFGQFVGLRLNEHAFHTWDVEVAVDPGATIPRQAAELVIDNLELIARYTGKPTGDTTTITVATTDPQRGFTVDLKPDSVTFGASTAAVPADVELPAEAFARLVYGRLDPEHTPPGDHGPALDTLRRVFPGP
jgi:uncharacterized protein (TIGR03083 family)